mmetsp:Transcript_8341/g.21205  ORF Transcript_8341/g.21205 Transcript_8341/m.21205 type:complete len:489 (-) Transcript_8341:211-1677(-)|eukprot:CAMPEP_0117505212 /NCGR_PEP_ID=MMETSP0784-20121206/25260_1 /TAXON_ID=39447 /ORGANISM="" /LENGTH=488 /DNA_ID=CAMNT_0005300615 /DNA_START=31 /DNA_END=1497 /DNA_ORIENTATION=-
MAPVKRVGRSAAVVGSNNEDAWCIKNAELIARADEIIGERLSDARHRGDFTGHALVDEIFNNVMTPSLRGSTVGAAAAGSDQDCNGSVLILGESGSGKTHAVEYCIEKLRKQCTDNVVILRAYGGAYSTDVECIRHLAAQVPGSSLREAPRRNSAFETCMEWIRGVLREGLRHTSAAVIVLEKFEHFCSTTRQTLLYNLFDIAQEAGVRLSIIGTSEKMDVMDLLEKRIKSRFSMRHLHAFRPTEMDDLVDILLEKLRLPDRCGLPKPFIKQLNGHLEAAIRARSAEWAPHLDVGMPASWFLWKCLPVAGMLRSAAPTATAIPDGLSPTPSKRRRASAAGSMPSSTNHEVQRMLVEGLSEDEHLVQLALNRLQARGADQTLSMILHEVRLLHECGAMRMLTPFSQDRYTEAFDSLVHSGLVELARGTVRDPSRPYLPCASRVAQLYERLVDDIRGTIRDASGYANPLSELPEPVKQWAMMEVRRADTL